MDLDRLKKVYLQSIFQYLEHHHLYIYVINNKLLTFNKVQPLLQLLHIDDCMRDLDLFVQLLELLEAVQHNQLETVVLSKKITYLRPKL